MHVGDEADKEGEREASVEGFVQQGRSDCGEAEEDEEDEEPEEEEGEFFHGLSVLACAAADFAVIAGRGVAEEALAVGVVATGGVVRFSGGGYPVATGGGGSGVRRGS